MVALLVATPSACGDATAGETTSGETSSGETLDERFFGEFHSEHAVIGGVYEPPAGDKGWALWQNVEFLRDGSVIFENNVCGGLEPRMLSWGHVAGSQEIELFPNAGGFIVLWDEDYSQVRFRLGACGELVGTYTLASDGEAKTLRFPPGRVCSVSMDCPFEIVACDTSPFPDACPAP